MNTTTAPTTAGPTGTTSTTSRKASLASILVLLTSLLFGFAAVSPAEAATGTTTVRLCANKPSVYAATPSISAYWWNGSSWQQQATVRGSCATFTLGHSGYYYFRAASWVIAGCTEYVYGWTSNALIKQNLPATNNWTVNLPYEYAVGIC